MNKEIRPENFIESTVFLVIVKFLSFLPLFLFPLLAKSVPTVIFGQILLAITIERFLNVIYEYGLHIPNIKNVSKLKIKDSDKISSIFSKVASLRISLWVLILISTNLLILHLTPESINLDYLNICLLVGLLRNLNPLWVFQGLKIIRYQLILAFFSKLTFVSAVTLLFINEELGAQNFLFFYLIAEIVAFSLSLLFFYRLNFKVKIFSPFNLKKTLKDSTGFFFGRLSSIGYNSLSPIILGIINPINFAFYAAAERIFIGLQAINAPIMDSIYAHRISDKITRFKAIALIVVVGSMFISAVIMYFADPIILFLFGNDFIVSSKILFIFCIAFSIQALSSVIGHPYLTLKGYGNITNNSVSWGFLVCMIISLMFFYFDFFNAYSITLILLITEIFVLLYRVMAIKRFKI